MLKVHCRHKFTITTAEAVEYSLYHLITPPLPNMSKSCLITGKKTTVGMHVSHSKRRVKRKLFANLQTRRLLNPATGRMVMVTISNRGLRTLKKWDREGKKYDLVALKKAEHIA